MRRRNLVLLASALLGAILLLMLAVWLLEDASAPSVTEPAVAEPPSTTMTQRTAEAALAPAADLPVPPDESRLPHRLRRRAVEDRKVRASSPSVPAARGRLVGRLRVDPSDANARVTVTVPCTDKPALLRTPGMKGSELILGPRVEVEPPDHRFEFADLVAGAYEVTVWRGAEDVAHSRVDVRGRTEVALELPPIREDESLILHVIDNAGQHLEGMRFLLTYDSGMRGVDSEMRSDGSYRLGPSGVIADALAGGLKRRSLVVSRSDVGTETAELIRGNRELTVVFDLSSRADLVVDLKGYRADTHGDVRVVVEESPGPEQRVHDTVERVVDLSGRARFELLKPGAYDMKIMAYASDPDPPTGSALEREIAAFQSGFHVPVLIARANARLELGSNRLQVSLPPLHRLTVWANLWEAGGVMISRTDDREAPAIWRRLGPGPGSVAFDRLPAGRYQVRTSENGSVVVLIPDRTEVRFERL